MNEKNKILGSIKIYRNSELTNRKTSVKIQLVERRERNISLITKFIYQPIKRGSELIPFLLRTYICYFITFVKIMVSRRTYFKSINLSFYLFYFVFALNIKKLLG